MEILLIGNGFDLAHKLPTQYKDFLDFCERVSRIYKYVPGKSTLEYQNINLDTWDMNTTIKGILRNAYDNRKFETKTAIVRTSNKSLDELYVLINNNFWLGYFLSCTSYKGENWIDFEAEISRVIRILDDVRKMTEQGKSVMEIDNDYMANIIKTIIKKSHKEIREIFKDLKSIDEFVVLLDNDLKRLIRALKYMQDRLQIL